LEILDWLSINYDGKVLRQSKRLEIYKEYAKELLNKKIAYEKENAVWVKVSQDKIFSWIDLVGNKKISFSGKDQEDFVILKSDGFPTYHLANVVDDHLMEITHVIRGEEWISSTPKHIHLYQSFGWEMPQFAHLSVILGPDKAKLSKRHGAKSVLDYRDEGYVKEALLNYMALLGWNPGSDKEVMSLEEMIPAPGQAALGIEILLEDQRARSLAAPINRFRSQAETLAERSFLAAMGGGCLEPVAAIGRAANEQLTLRGVVFSADGMKRWEDEIAGSLREHEDLGRKLAEKMKAKGARI